MMDKIYYWDSSAILSLLIKDKHSEQAIKYYNKTNVNIISSLVIAEVLAVIARIEREQKELKILLDACRKSFQEGRWRLVTLSPTFDDLQKYSQLYSLRGADLWHLTLGLSIKQELPSIKIITFDKKLEAAAKDLEIRYE